MITPQQIIDGMADKNRMLTQKNDEYIELSEKRAENERSFSKAFARKMIELKIEGQSVTLIEKIAKGDDVVADMKYALDVSEGVCKACLNSIKAVTTQIDSYRSLLAWQKAELLRTE